MLDRQEADVHFVWMAQKYDRAGLNLAGYIWVIDRLFYADEGAHIVQCRELDVHEASFFRIRHSFDPVVAGIVCVETLRLHCLRDASQRKRNSRLCAAPCCFVWACENLSPESGELIRTEVILADQTAWIVLGTTDAMVVLGELSTEEISVCKALLQALS